MASTTLVRSRRELNTRRRAGTGRQTTKRDFSLNLRKLLAAHTSAIHPRLPLKERTAAEQQRLQTVDEAAASCSASLAEEGIERVGPADASGACASGQQQPQAFDPAHAPTPFRRSNKVMRTPAASKDNGPSISEVAESDAVSIPMAALDDVDELPACEAAPEETAQHEDGAAALDSNSWLGEVLHIAHDADADATHPPPPATHSPSHEERERLRKSMGTSPIAPELLMQASAPSPTAGPSSSASIPSTPLHDATAAEHCMQAETSTVPELMSSTGHGVAADDGSVGSDDGGASDFGSPGFNDTASLAGDEEQVQGEEAVVPEEMPPPPAPSLAAVLQEHVVSKTSSRKAAASARKRKTSLDKIGRLPGKAAESTGLVVDEQGGRRSKRNRMPPLEFWRGERVEYGRRDSAKFEVPVSVTRQAKEATPTWVLRARARVAHHDTEQDGAKRARKTAQARQAASTTSRSEPRLPLQGCDNGQ